QQAVHQVWSGAAVIYNFFHVNKEWNKVLKQSLGANGPQQIVTYRKEMKSYMRSVIHQINTMNDTNHIKVTVLNAHKVGRINAAKVLNIDVSSIPTTNNCIESLDNHLNKESLRQLQRRGTQLRVDVLVMYLVECVTPNFMKRRKFQKSLEENLKIQQTNYIDQRYVELLKANYKYSVYTEPDKERDDEAKKIAASFRGIVKYEYTDKLNVWMEDIPLVTLPSREVAELDADDDIWMISDETEDDSSEEVIEISLKTDDKLKATQNIPTILPNLKETSTNVTSSNPKQDMQNTCRSILNSLQSISETSKSLDNVALNSKNSNNVKKGRNHFEHGKRALQGLIQSDDWKIALFNFQALLTENQPPSKKPKLDVSNVT
ncbi:13651_t:CDS:2, partial [Racocetra fulgida]